MNIIGRSILKNENVTIEHAEGIETGLFFRKPIQRVQITTDSYGNESRSGYHHSVYIYMKRCKNPIRKLYEYILGNKESIRQIILNQDDISFYGVKVNVLCSPIYFSRRFRSLKAISENPRSLVFGVESKGYESNFNLVSGACVVEKSTIDYADGHAEKQVSKGKYDLTYPYSVKEMFK